MNRRISRRDTSPPLVSIILCTYNRAHLVTRAIASVLAQSYGQWELIVVDDGSVDSTELVVMPIVKSDPRIRYLYQANRGVAFSRNVGIALARGTYTTFVDSDDEYRAQHLLVRIQTMERRRSLALIYGGIEFVGPLGKRYVADVEHPGQKIHLRYCYAGATFFAHTAVFRKLKGFRDLPYALDLDFIRRMRFKDLTIAKATTPTYRYHLDSKKRLCDLYERGGKEAILEFQTHHRK